MTEARRRLQSARDRLAAAETLLDTGHHPDSVSRAYYGVYGAARTLLLVKNVETSTHAGVGNRLGFHYRDDIDTRSFSRLRSEREGCDYELSEPSEERTRTCLQQARSFVEQPEALVNEAS
ncbi:HEPN domain-containing protein [Salinibacter ruber]|uniref:HEPN domain-containing protein n=1 Tax=Salinibacter ruber TaxID=146919 RepID=UPI000E57D3F2